MNKTARYLVRKAYRVLLGNYVSPKLLRFTNQKKKSLSSLEGELLAKKSLLELEMDKKNFSETKEETKASSRIIKSIQKSISSLEKQVSILEEDINILETSIDKGPRYLTEKLKTEMHKDTEYSRFGPLSLKDRARSLFLR